MIKNSILLTTLLLLFLATHSQAKDTALSAREVLTKSGVKGGLVVHVGSGDSGTIADFYASESFIVQGLYSEKEKVDQARKHLKQKGLYGKVSVRHWENDFLPYADNMVNLVVAENPIPIAEVMRVLAPRGTAYIKNGKNWEMTVKPWPKEIDEWTHFLHGPDNNAVAEDTTVDVPKHVQWIGDPKFARSHDQLASVSSMVSSRGRLFYIIDQGETADIRLPARWQLIARDAFNGVVLWTKEINEWHDHMRKFRSGPADLPFRLVAIDERVYVTLDRNKPVKALDAATGETLKTYEGTENTHQIMYADNRLVMLTGTSQAAIHIDPKGNQSGTRSITTADPETGAVLWKKDIDRGALIPLVVSGGSLMYQTTKELICLELHSGKEKWRTAHPLALAKPKSKIWSWATPTLTAQNDIVYVADFKSLSAISIEDGEILWKTSSAQGFASPPDIFLINELMWRGYVKNRNIGDFGQGLNAKTGKIEKTLDTEKAWDFATLAHARCYRPKATSRFILASRSGIEFIDVDSGEIKLNHWLRGTCQYGVLPCNGLLYAPPHSCACNIKTMVRGLRAFAPANPASSNLQAKAPRLVQGPAFGKVDQETAAAKPSEDWPIFRHDNERSGRASTQVPQKLKQKWQTNLGGALSTLVASKGKIFVSEIDAHTIHALDATNGKSLWSFTAGGRIDSPPTVYNNRVFFGSADGWVYCVRETDGTLIWRFRGAPKERSIVVRGQVESAWPIHGSVLIHNDTLIVAAGRSSYIDGGIHLTKLNPDTGEILSETLIDSLDPETGEQPPGGVDLRGVLNDVLAASGDAVYMRHLKINFETGDDLETGPPHLFAPMGFLDNEWWHRSYWLYGSDAVCMPPTNESGWKIWSRMGNMVPSGRILSLGENTVFGYGRDKYPQGGAGQIRGGEKYHLFAAEKEAFEPLPSYKDQQHLRSAKSGKALGLTQTERDKNGGGPSLHHYGWSQQTPIFAKALVLSGNTLFLAGPPELEDARRTELTLEDPEKLEAAFQGKLGASLCVVSAANGKQLAKYELESPPVFDGMIAAQEKIFMSLEDGSIICFGK